MQRDELFEPQEHSLRHCQWELKGFWPWVPLKGTSMEIGDELLGVTDWMPATVPGGVHQDLFRAGLIDNPYIDLNSLSCEWVENRWWVYKAEVPVPEVKGKRLELLCKGLDYEALIYWNGELLGEHKGMYEPARFVMTSEQTRGRQSGELMIVLKHAPDEMGQIGKTSDTFTQKSRFNYKWDFSTRLVNVGIWDDICFIVKQAYAIGETALHTDVKDGDGHIKLAVAIEEIVEQVDDLWLTVQITDPSGAEAASCTQQVRDAHNLQKIDISIERPQLWYPNGYGEQPLYEVMVTVHGESIIYDRQRLRAGIRSLAYARNEESPQDALPYTVIVNGIKIYLRGANITPLDHLYGNVGRERYEWLVHAVKHANMNMLRIWGGGIIEKSMLYELCDQHGIMIWQEFIQSSSGIDNIPSKRPEFLRLLERTALQALKTRRSHVSLTIWSGGNELMSEPNVPSTYEDENLAMLKQLVQQHDSQRLFLPTSASGPVQYITAEKGISHDVHGHWKYQGNPVHYELYSEADHLFHSEFGVDGLSAVKSIRKFIGEQHRKPVSMKESLVWRHHGEWWDTYDRDTELFGKLAHLSAFSAASQWMQAEGLRFILQSNRRRAFRNSGSLIWQMNEPWPNVSCTNLIDYYNEAKMAYYWVREAFAPKHAWIDYRKLDYLPDEQLILPVYVMTDASGETCTVLAQVLDSRGNLIHEQSFSGKTQRNAALQIGFLIVQAPHVEDGLFYVQLRFEQAGEQDRGVYIFSTRSGALYAGAWTDTAANLSAKLIQPWQTADSGEGLPEGALQSSFIVRNEGHQAALHVHAEEKSDCYWLTASASHFTLFPGEQRLVTVTCRRRAEELFAERAQEPMGTELQLLLPDVRFYSFTDMKD
ncbi:beta-mannosidase [Paenibacillus endophyticus]|uniref:beta-mannosidase n=1 Tax=Paenibacillus endophyticus TaxID=1294268 RepID=A0A7W5CB91_9BACL|nr:glycoside hydrolase family 2 TIM barrel-domain containing protein [Paenibacillus endophyticus]MBB3154095.1 beta-mannosidase [Paenibacillus endophyticus]